MGYAVPRWFVRFASTVLGLFVPWACWLSINVIQLKERSARLPQVMAEVVDNRNDIAALDVRLTRVETKQP